MTAQWRRIRRLLAALAAFMEARRYSRRFTGEIISNGNQLLLALQTNDDNLAGFPITSPP
jgi:hypothetical protein